jgi:hypothetical protein
MQWLARPVLGLMFVVGAAIGIVIGVLAIFWISLVRGKRVVHADGVLCRAEITATDRIVGPRLAGPAIVRLSGAFEDQETKASDVLGFELRAQREASDDPEVGDQDLVFGTFTSFRHAARDRAQTNIGDYCGNTYHSVTLWTLPELGPQKLTLLSPPAAPKDRGTDRLARLEADLEAKRARFTLNAGVRELATIKLLDRIAVDDAALQVSMFRCGRGIRPTGLLNGIRATVYPLGQLGRRLRAR